MNRLTEKEASGKWQVRGIPWEALQEGKTITKEIRQLLHGCLCKLRDYEDSELNPDQIRILLYQISAAGIYACDSLCRYLYEVTDQEELDNICAGCQMNVCMDWIEELTKGKKDENSI